MTVFVTTHYMDEAEYCDRLGLIYRGELIAVGHAGGAEDRRGCAKHVLEVFCERPEDGDGARSRALPGVKEVGAVRQRRCTWWPPDAARPPPGASARRSRTAGFAVGGIEEIVPSLEDVFVSLIEARDREPSSRRRRCER